MKDPNSVPDRKLKVSKNPPNDQSDGKCLDSYLKEK